MTRKVWAAIVCLLILAVSIGGFLVRGDMYDTHSPVYRFVARITPKAEIDRAEAYGLLVQHQDMNGLRQASDPKMVDPNFDAAIAHIATFYPMSAPTSVAPVQYSRTASTGGVNVSQITITHTYADGSVMLTTTVTNMNTGKVMGFNLRKLSPADLRKLRFDPWHATATQAALLAAAAAVFLFTLATAYVCLETPGLKWKWLWFLFIMAGIGSLRFNWLTLAMQVTPIDIRWGASGFFQMLLQPAVVYINLPIGALIFWLTGRNLKPGA